jgi:phosphodiesterase/alkaline phosphatase D-like protein
VGKEGSIVLITPFSRIIGGEPTPSPNRTFTRLLASCSRAAGISALTTRRKGGTIHRFLGLAVLVSTIVLAFAGAAVAATPSAITGPVNSVGPTTATVTGTVNPNGQATTWYVEYGTSTAYGARTANQSAGSGTANTAVSANLTGLTPGTTYHYRVVATNSSGTARGSDGIFTTSSAPVAVTGSATNITVTSATLNGTVDPNGRETIWYFEYGTSTSYGSKTAEKNAGSGTNAVSVSVPVSGLTRGRLYHYRLVATSDAGTSRGADQTFSTTTSPVAVTGSASSIGLTSAKLNGTVTPNGQAATWFFEYGTTTRYGSRTATKSVGTGTRAVKVAASLTRLRTSTTYHYRLVATNDSGTSVGTNRSFSTSLAPGVRTGPAQDVGPTTATLTGSADPGGRTTTWWFEYGTTTRYGSRTSSRSVGSSAGSRSVSAAVSGLAAGTVYHYRLVAKSDAGTSRGADATFTTLGVTLNAPALRVVYGRGITLSGSIPTKRAGETVTLFAQSSGEGSFHSIATVLTAADGTWRYLAKPRIRTSYLASWSGGRSGATVVGVQPAIALRRTSAGLVSTRVTGARSFAGRFVQLQRRTAAGRWVTIKRVRLNARSAALLRPMSFRAALPRGASTLRIAMSVNQAGVGYLGGFSRTIVFRRS